MLLAAMCAAALAFTACETPPVWNWPDFPEERFKAYLPYEEVEEVRFVSYLPYEEGETVRFVSDTGDSTTWSISAVEYYYEEPCGEIFAACYGNESVIFLVSFENGQEQMRCDLLSSYRNYFSYGIGYGDTLLCAGAGDVSKIRGDVSKIRDFDKLLTDTLRCDEVGDCVIVNGEGLAEYTMDEVRWRAAE